MLIEFKVANFRSFHEEQTFSLVASKDKAHPDNLIDCGKFKLLKAAAVYGANASGKSNLIKAIRVMEQLVRSSATKLNVGDPIAGISPFRLHTQSRKSPSRFEVTLQNDETQYVYGFSATTERVHDEWLRVRRPGGRLSKWLERKLDPGSGKTRWEIKGPLKKDEKLLREKTRDNCLVLSRGAELNIGLLKSVFRWFREKVQIYDLSQAAFSLARETAKRAKSDDIFHARVSRMLQDADLGIVGIDVSEIPFSEMSAGIPEQLKVAVRDLAEELLVEKEPSGFKVSTRHESVDSAEMVSFSLERDESNGTQRYFALVGPILEVLEEGAVLVVDELECSMHPLLTRKLIELFQSPEMNKTGAQLVFATHDSSVMDSSLLRRDQVWLTEKNQSGATELFSLYDFDTKTRPRNTEAFEKNYLAGRYGGIPHFGPALEDLEIQ